MPATGGIRAGRAFVELFVEDSRLVRGLRQAQRRLQAFGAAVRGLGTRLAGLGALMGAPLLAGTRVFADFEQQMAQVSTMLQEPDRFMDRFRAGIRAMSAEFGESTATLAQGLYDILSASVPAEKALDVLAVSARAAKAGITDSGPIYGVDLTFTVDAEGRITGASLAGFGDGCTVITTGGWGACKTEGGLLA